MDVFKSHPFAAGIVVGVVLGIVFHSQVSKLPLVNKLPSA
jgi:F0F1-type ATP synthase assembly protein I